MRSLTLDEKEHVKIALNRLVDLAWEDKVVENRKALMFYLDVSNFRNGHARAFIQLYNTLRNMRKYLQGGVG